MRSTSIAEGWIWHPVPTKNPEAPDFEVVARAVRDAIEKNEPETGLDRLHTFVIKYVRMLCKERGLLVTREKPLHSLFGEYVKSVQEPASLNRR